VTVEPVALEKRKKMEDEKEKRVVERGLVS
jgi:hypothetical protein